MFPLATFLIMIGSIAPASWAQQPASSCGELDREVEYQDIECLVAELIQTQFPALKEAQASGRIVFEKVKTEDFIRASKGSGHTYTIEVNPTVYRTFLPKLPRPSLKATRGILARELIRLVDLETLTAATRTKNAVQRALDPAEAERAIDERAFTLGYSEEIAEFRTWSYSRLEDPDLAESLERTKKRYYTPEQIQYWKKQKVAADSTLNPSN